MINNSFSFTKYTGVLLAGILLCTSLNAQVDSYSNINNSGSSSTKSKTRAVGDQAVDTTALPDSYGKVSGTSSINPNFPVTVVNDSTSGGLFSDKKSLRRDNILADDPEDSTSQPLEYAPLYSTDVLARVRVWRVIDGSDPKNQPYFFNASIDGGGSSTRLISVILNAMLKDSIQAFSPIDDMFTTPISLQQALAALSGGKDTSDAYDLNGNIIGYQVRQKAVNPDSIYKFRLKEEWVFDKRDGRTHVRILGIAPLISYTSSTGETAENSEHAAFWIYYPDLRKDLVKTYVQNPMTNRAITWEEVFENRLFSSYIIKSSIDAQNGFVKEPLTTEQGDVIQKQLNNLSKQMWRARSNAIQ